MIIKSALNEADVLALSGRIINPSLMLLGPFMPLFLDMNSPISFLFLLIPLIDFFILPTKLCRKYIVNYEIIYIALLVFSSSVKVMLSILSLYYWVFFIICIPFIMVLWGRFALNNWHELYRLAQKE